MVCLGGRVVDMIDALSDEPVAGPDPLTESPYDPVGPHAHLTDPPGMKMPAE